jgi:hypothetical protein
LVERSSIPFRQPERALGKTHIFLDCPPTMSKGIGRVVEALRANLPKHAVAFPRAAPDT